MKKILTTAAIAAVLTLPGAAFANHNFADHDTNGDGKITEAEARAGWETKFKDKWAMKDTNKDGTISKAEFDAYKAKHDDDDHDDDHDND